MLVCKLDSVMDQYDRKSEFTESLCVYSVSNVTKCIFKCYALAQGRKQIDTAFTYSIPHLQSKLTLKFSKNLQLLLRLLFWKCERNMAASWNLITCNYLSVLWLPESVCKKLCIEVNDKHNFSFIIGINSCKHGYNGEIMRLYPQMWCNLNQ